MLVTDGAPGDVECLHADCALSPPGPGCACEGVVSARAINQQLGAKVYVIGFSAEVANPESVIKLDNIARAGGTTEGYFATSETGLYNAMATAIYDSVKGSYATSPVAVGTNDSDLSTANSIILDSRADFPSWKGHLIAYDASATPPTLLWDAATGFDPAVDANFWKKRNIWTSDGATMVKIQVDATTGAIGNASQLRTLGLGTTDAEAALVARWMLGDPSMKNPAVFGAIVNSTPTQVGRPPSASLTYAGSSSGMLHAFHSRNQTVGGTSYLGGREAFAYIPQDLLKTIRRLFAQGGQRRSPRDHFYGVANSAKVKKICTSNCATPGMEVYKMALVMPEGFGGSDVFALDIGSPFSATGIRSALTDPPVKLLWNTETTVSSTDKAAYDGALGKTISLPGFYYAKNASKDDFRSIWASGYTDATNSAIGLKLVNASTSTGAIVSSHSVVGMGAGCTKTKVDPTEPTMLTDVPVARRFGSQDYERIAAAYVGDTWGNLFRYVPSTDSEGNVLGATGSLTVVDSFTCSHPLHFSPTVVQLDRHDSSKNPGQIYLAQVTNSAMDLNTDDWSTGFPASQIIIRKDVAAAGSAVNPDSTWGDASGRIVLNANNSAQICGKWNNSTKTCTTALPSNARPVSSPAGILRDDFNGFSLVTLWYVPNASGCTKGETYLTIHEVTTGESVGQIYGDKIADEPVVGAVFAAGKLMVVLASGPKEITANNMGAITVEQTLSGAHTTLVDRYRRIGWTELP
jgi:hypothetical protein